MPRVAPRQVRAYAKINLALAVGPPIPPGEPDAGYHPIASWMHAIDLHDTVEITPASQTTHDIAWVDGTPVAWETRSDLCVRAHEAVEALADRALPATIRVRKSIPAGGGLGGGSSDAAAVLLLLRDVFGLPIGDEQLMEAGRSLGSDIAFFLDTDTWRAGQPPRPAMVTGLGDRIRRLERRAEAITLWCPPYGCSTGAVYRRFDTSPTRACDEARVRELVSADRIDESSLFNDLADAAEAVEPRLAEARARLRRAAGRPVHVSGSGSTLFCVGLAEEVLGSQQPGRTIRSYLR